MRPSTASLLVVIVILVGALVYQTRRRHAAEESLAVVTTARIAAKTPAPARADGPTQLTLDALVQENRRLRAKAEATPPGAATGSTGKVAELRDVFARLPEQAIPELALATDGDWYSAVDGPLETPEDFRLALSKLRTAAEGRFAKLLQPALRNYLEDNSGRFPTEPIELASYFRDRIDPIFLQRYKVVPADEVKSVRVGGEWALTQRSLVDSKYDSRIVIGPFGFGTHSRR